MCSFQNYLKRKQKEFSNFDSSDLASQFIPYFNSGQRIEVQFKYGETIRGTLRGTIGITTGWKPCFLLMLTKRSISSAWALGKEDKIVKVIC